MSTVDPGLVASPHGSLAGSELHGDADRLELALELGEDRSTVRAVLYPLGRHRHGEASVRSSTGGLRRGRVSATSVSDTPGRPVGSRLAGRRAWPEPRECGSDRGPMRPTARDAWILEWTARRVQGEVRRAETGGAEPTLVAGLAGLAARPPRDGRARRPASASCRSPTGWRRRAPGLDLLKVGPGGAPGGSAIASNGCGRSPW